MPDEEVTAEEIAQHYTAMGYSVDLINEIVASGDTDEVSIDCKARNQKHLELMVAKDFWTTEDMTAVNAAINV
jgi:hypothetical protein